MSYQNTIPKPKNPTQGHITSFHKDISYATKTTIMPRRYQICHKYINYATKKSIYHKNEVPRYQCHKGYSIWLGNHTYHSIRVKTTLISQLDEIETRSSFPSSFIKLYNIQVFHKVLKFSKIVSCH